jgi:hypothetical protein
MPGVGVEKEVAMTEFTLDMTMMLAIHDALRRDLARVGELESGNEGWSQSHLLEHLEHAERDALPLVDRTLSPEQWMTFGQASAQRMGPDMPSYMPWLIDDVAEDEATHLLSLVLSPVRQVYADQWRPAFLATLSSARAFPPPTGPYGTGTVTYHWVDAERAEVQATGKIPGKAVLTPWIPGDRPIHGRTRERCPKTPVFPTDGAPDPGTLDAPCLLVCAPPIVSSTAGSSTRS